MIEYIHDVSSPDSSYAMLQGELNRMPVNIRVNSIAIDDLISQDATPEQRRRFARHNRDAFADIAQSKIDRRDYEIEDWLGREAFAVRINGADISQYTSESGNQLSFAAFRPELQARAMGADGRF